MIVAISRVDSIAKARLPPSANIWKPICAGFRLIGIANPESFPPTASRPGRISATRRGDGPGGREPASRSIARKPIRTAVDRRRRVVGGVFASGETSGHQYHDAGHASSIGRATPGAQRRKTRPDTNRSRADPPGGGDVEAIECSEIAGLEIEKRLGNAGLEIMVEGE